MACGSWAAFLESWPADDSRLCEGSATVEKTLQRKAIEYRRLRRLTARGQIGRDADQVPDPEAKPTTRTRASDARAWRQCGHCGRGKKKPAIKRARL